MDSIKDQQKFIFITGGVVSSLGKGLIAASLGTLLEARKYKISLIKCDPYLNVDPGTLSPFQHGEVYVTQDGAETDMDLGHYERFTTVALKKQNSITTGQVYENVILKERKGEYLGNTVQVIPHITDEIKSRIKQAAGSAQVVIVEIGGTIGDIESLPFIEATRQMRWDLGEGRTTFVHLVLLPHVSTAGEVKSKPAQHSVRALMEVGIHPDFLVGRSQEELTPSLKKKLALFCSVKEDHVVSAPDVNMIYEIPLLLQKQGFDQKLVKRLELLEGPSEMGGWRKIIETLRDSSSSPVSVGLVGKYVELKDSYQSIHEALKHGGLANKSQVQVKFIVSEKLKPHNVADYLKGLHGVLIPGGFGERGIEGKIAAIQYIREQGIPFFGICFGMQMAVLEFARHVCRLRKAVSREFEPPFKKEEDSPVIDYLEGQTPATQKGGSMRLGSYVCALKEGSLAHQVYGIKTVRERHRHRFEFNNQYKSVFEKNGMFVSGVNPEHNLAEIIEIPGHPWFLGVQFHPEFQSRPLKPHPLFTHFIRACLDHQKKKPLSMPPSAKLAESTFLE